MSRQIVAIDIRTTSITAVLLNTGLKTSTLEGCAHMELPDAGNGTSAALSGALADLRRTIDFGRAGVVIGLPAARTIFRAISVPFKDEKKIRQILPYELEPGLPTPVDQLIIDYLKGRETDGTEILAAALERRDLDETLAALSSVDLRPRMVMPGDIALAVILAAHDPELPDQALILSVGYEKATLMVMVDRMVALVRCLPSETRTTEGVHTLALAVRQTIAAFADQQIDGFSPATLFLSGPALEESDRGSLLKGVLDIPCRMMDLRSMLPKIGAAADIPWQPARMNSALAMALVEAESRPCPAFFRTGSVFSHYWTHYRPFLRGPAIALTVVLFLGLGGLLLENHLLQQRLDNVRNEAEALFADAFPGTRRVGDPLSQMKSELRRLQGDAIEAGQTMPQVRTVDILNELSRLIPDNVDVVLTRMSLGADGLTVSGETEGFNVVDDIKVRLERSNLFQQVTIASANMDRSGRKVRFSLKLDI